MQHLSNCLEKQSWSGFSLTEKPNDFKGQITKVFLRKNVIKKILNKENSGDRLYGKLMKVLWKYKLEKFRSSLQFGKVIVLEVLQDDVKNISKETFYKTYYPIL